MDERENDLLGRRREYYDNGSAILVFIDLSLPKNVLVGESCYIVDSMF